MSEIFELMSCPFCGESPYMCTHINGGKYWVECINENCKVKPKTDKMYSNKSEAREAWNTRKEEE